MPLDRASLSDRLNTSDETAGTLKQIANFGANDHPAATFAGKSCSTRLDRGTRSVGSESSTASWFGFDMIPYRVYNTLDKVFGLLRQERTKATTHRRHGGREETCAAESSACWLWPDGELIAPCARACASRGRVYA